MAFCPNCGTPNPEQEERCAACGFELTVPKAKAKFKGTIMMSGIKAPTAQQPDTASKGPEPAPEPEPAPTPRSTSSLPPLGKNLSYQKTMMGQPAVSLPPPATPSPSTPPPASASTPQSSTPLYAPLPTLPPRQSASTPPPDLGSMPTMQGAAPVQLPSEPSTPSEPASFTTGNTHDFEPDLASSATQLSTPSPLPVAPTPAAPTPAPVVAKELPSTPSIPAASIPSGPTQRSAPQQPAFSSSSSGKTLSNAKSPAAARVPAGGAYESTMPPAATPPNPAKVIAAGCAVVLALVLVVGGALWFAVGDRLKSTFGGGDAEANAAEAAAWHASISQSLTKVNELCAADCAQAGVFFHPLKQNTLLPEAKALTPARVAKLNDPTNAKAVMLDHTEDSAVATQLGLDPQQCARVTAGGAKVISCSVPDATGKPSVLRIVQLSGVSTL